MKTMCCVNEDQSNEPSRQRASARFPIRTKLPYFWIFSFLQQVQKDLLSFMKPSSNHRWWVWPREDLGMAKTLVSLTQERCNAQSLTRNCFIKEKKEKKVFGKILAVRNYLNSRPLEFSHDNPPSSTTSTSTTKRKHIKSNVHKINIFFSLSIDNLYNDMLTQCFFFVRDCPPWFYFSFFLYWQLSVRHFFIYLFIDSCL